METKEIKEISIDVPDGYEIDKENSTFEYIKLKPIENKRWRDDKEQQIRGFVIDDTSSLIRDLSDNFRNIPLNYNIFVTEKQAKSALAMARISQIMANDKRFGGVVSDEEWKNGDKVKKYVIIRCNNTIEVDAFNLFYCFLAFHTKEQRDLFLEENKDLIRDYFML